MVAAKPDCTGQRFGRLIVLGIGEIVRRPIKNPTSRRKFRSRRLWRCQCDCGAIINVPRGDLEKLDGRRSCGCLVRERKGKPHKNAADYTNQRFGQLTALERIPGKFKHGHKPVWKCLCDCGNIVERSTQELRQGYARGRHCGDWSKHEWDWGMWYPPTPLPYPTEAGAIVAKYLHLTRLPYERVDQAVEDERLDRLMRAAWVLVYRRSQGEEFTELGERRFIWKYLRYCGLTVYWRRKIEAFGGVAYKMDGAKMQMRIGDAMTEFNIACEAVNPSTGETQPISILPIRRVKKLKFRRC